MLALKIGFTLAVAILAFAVFSISTGAVTLFLLRKKYPGSSFAALQDTFERNAAHVFGIALSQRVVIRGISCGMSAVIFLVNLFLRVRRRAGMHREDGRGY